VPDFVGLNPGKADLYCPDVSKMPLTCFVEVQNVRKRLNRAGEGQAGSPASRPAIFQALDNGPDGFAQAIETTSDDDPQASPQSKKWEFQG